MIEALGQGEKNRKEVSEGEEEVSRNSTRPDRALIKTHIQEHLAQPRHLLFDDLFRQLHAALGNENEGQRDPGSLVNCRPDGERSERCEDGVEKQDDGDVLIGEEGVRDGIDGRDNLKRGLKRGRVDKCREHKPRDTKRTKGERRTNVGGLLGSQSQEDRAYLSLTSIEKVGLGVKQRLEKNEGELEVRRGLNTRVIESRGTDYPSASLGRLRLTGIGLTSELLRYTKSAEASFGREASLSFEIPPHGISPLPPFNDARPGFSDVLS